MGDNLNETYDAGNMRPSHRPESVKEVLDIIQQQNHYARHPSAQSGDVTKGKNPLPAIKGSTPQTSRQLQDTLEGNILNNDAGFQLEHSKFDYQELRKHTQRLDLNDQNHILSGDLIKTTSDLSSLLQREGTRHQLPPLSLRSDSRGNNSHSDESKRGTISSTKGSNSHSQLTQARPSTGYGRRSRAASCNEDLIGHESREVRDDQKSSVSHISSKGKSYKNDQRPRSSYGSRVQLSSEHSQEIVESTDTSSNRDASYIKHNDYLNTKPMTNNYGKPALSKNEHRPLRECRSHGEEDYSRYDQGQERTVPNTTFIRPKSSKGRYRQPPSRRLSRPESDLTDSSMGVDLVRPGAPTPPSDILDDGQGITGMTGDPYARNRTSRLMTL